MTILSTPSYRALAVGAAVAALQQADQAVSRVTGALRSGGVAAADLQTSGLSIQPNYLGSSQTPVGADWLARPVVAR